MIIQYFSYDPATILGPACDNFTALPQRSGGLHLSDIYGDIENTIAPRADEADMGKLELSSYRSGGFLWERIFSMAMAEEFRRGDIVRPGEFEVDGITGSPDNVRLNNGNYRIIETKATWKTSRKWLALEKYHWMWLVQAKGYCRIMGTQEVEMYALYLVGDYKGSGPQYRSALWKFSEKEIMENWAMLKNHARKRGWL